MLNRFCPLSNPALLLTTPLPPPPQTISSWTEYQAKLSEKDDMPVLYLVHSKF